MREKKGIGPGHTQGGGQDYTGSEHQEVGIMTNQLRVYSLQEDGFCILYVQLYNLI